MGLEIITNTGYVTSTVTPHRQSFTIKNPNTVTATVTVALPLGAFEATQSVDRTLSGVLTTTSGAYSVSGIVIPARGQVDYVITSTYNAPTDAQGVAITKGTTTKTLTVTQTHAAGVALGTAVTYYEVLETAFLGTGKPRFWVRPGNGGMDRVAVEEELLFGRNPQEVAAVYDWLECGGRNIADIIGFYETFVALGESIAAGLPAALDAAQAVPFASLTVAATSSNTTNAAVNAIRTQLLTLNNALR